MDKTDRWPPTFRPSAAPGAEDGDRGSEVREPALAHRVEREGRRLSSQHQALDVFFEMVQDAVARGSLREARTAFARFRDALDAHVTLEDEVFFPALHGLSHAMEGQLAGIVAEHAGIRESLDELHDLLAEGAVETLIGRLDRFASLVSDHEEREEQLVAAIVAASRQGR